MKPLPAKDCLLADRRLLLSCEHGGFRLPAEWRTHFASQQYWLKTHRGWDPGALEWAQFLARRLKAPLHATKWTRLLCDCNRDADNPDVFSPLGKQLDDASKQRILHKYHQPYRNGVESQLRQWADQGEAILHLSLHSFTPQLRGVTRPCELGIMFDSRIAGEKQLAQQLRAHLKQELKADPGFRIRFNYPYVGRSTYFQPALRRQFSAPQYLALQLEVNQKIPRQQKARWQKLQRALLTFLR